MMPPLTSLVPCMCLVKLEEEEPYLFPFSFDEWHLQAWPSAMFC